MIAVLLSTLVIIIFIIIYYGYYCKIHYYLAAQNIKIDEQCSTVVNKKSIEINCIF